MVVPVEKPVSNFLRTFANFAVVRHKRAVCVVPLFQQTRPLPIGSRISREAWGQEGAPRGRSIPTCWEFVADALSVCFSMQAGNREAVNARANEKQRRR